MNKWTKNLSHPFLIVVLVVAGCGQPTAPPHQTWRPTTPAPQVAEAVETPSTPEPPVGSTLPLRDVEALQQILEALAEANQVPVNPPAGPPAVPTSLPLNFGDL